MDEEAGGKILCDKIIPFDMIPKDCWIKFADMEDYLNSEKELYSMLISTGLCYTAI